jgi:hypothetical protein
VAIVCDVGVIAALIRHRRTRGRFADFTPLPLKKQPAKPLKAANSNRSNVNCSPERSRWIVNPLSVFVPVFLSRLDMLMCVRACRLYALASALF